MGPNIKILMGQSFGSWTDAGPGPWAQAWAHGGAGEVWVMGPDPGPWARPWAQAMGPCPCVQAPKLWPISILTFGPISIISIPDFQPTWLKKNANFW